MTEDQLYTLRDIKKDIGTLGEAFALAYEHQRLQHHPHLQDVAIVGSKDIGLGYDIRSFEGLTSTTPNRYIEVKTYSGQPHFFLSQGEWAAARKYAAHYYIYLIDSSRITIPGYEPLILRDPVNTLATNNNWSENIQQREYTLTPASPAPLPDDFDTSTILVACFKDNPHKNWILHYRYYNVRKDIRKTPQHHTPSSAQHYSHSLHQHARNVRLQDLEVISGGSRPIPGAVVPDEIAMDVKYLLLYNVCEPRSYRMYSVESARLATNAEMRALKYPNPRCPAYVLYRLSGVFDNIPGIDIMRILRTTNDKVARTSGTPVFISGRGLRQYFIDATASRMEGAPAPKRVFTNEGKPWSQNQSMRLEVLASMHRTIAEIAHELKRTPAEIHTQLHLLGLE